MLPMDDFIDTTGRNTDSDGELVLRNSEAFDEVFHEDFARVNRSNCCNRHRFPPVPTACLYSPKRRSQESRRAHTQKHHTRRRGAGTASRSLPPRAQQLPPAFNAYQKLESAPNQRCMVIHSSEGSSARKRLVFNVDYQSHRTLPHQDRTDLHNQALCRPVLLHMQA